MKDFWDERYSSIEFAYGEEANLYLKHHLSKIPIGSILFPADGEGRNSVYAASLGWTVSAFDLSQEGKNKALLLAKKNNVSIDYQVGEFQSLNYIPEKFDAIALIYAHFPAILKSSYHKKLATYLRKNGILIFEAFSKKQIEYNTFNPKAGGPKDIEMLFSLEEIKSDFQDFEIIELEEKEIKLEEGLFHAGNSAVIRFVGRKK